MRGNSSVLRICLFVNLTILLASTIWAGPTITASNAWTVSPTALSIAAAGDSGTISITSACPWTASSNAPWLGVSPLSGAGTGTAAYNVAQNSTTATRAALLTIAGKSVSVVQAAGAIAPPATGWTKRIGGTGVDYGSGVVLDNAAGGIYASGRFSGSVEFGAGPVASNSIDCFVACYGPSANLAWAKAYGGPGDEYPQALSIDSAGNLAVAGYLSGGESAGVNDIFLWRLKGDGSVVWQRRIGSSGNDAAYGVASDAGGEIVVAGSFTGTVDFGSPSGPLTAYAGGFDMFLAKFDPYGNCLWASKFLNTAADVGKAVAINKQTGEIAVCGYYTGTLDLGGGKFPTVSQGTAFVGKFDRLGNHLWSHAYPATVGGSGNAVCFDAAGNVLVGGSVAGAYDFGGGAGSVAYSSPFVLKLSSGGAYQWASVWPSYQGSVSGLGCDPQGNVAAQMTFSNTLGLPEPMTTYGGSDVALVRLSAAGAYLSGKHWGGAGTDTGFGLAVSPGGAVYATGGFWGSGTFGTAAGLADAYLVSVP